METTHTLSAPAPLIAKLKGLSPVNQAWLIIATCLFFQYSLNGLAYFELLPEIAGKSLNGATKNLTYVIPGTLAVLFTLFYEGRGGLLRLINPYRIIAKPRWWLFAALVLTPILYLSLYLDDMLYAEPLSWYPPLLYNIPELVGYIPDFIKVAISDELFWIGFVYPRLLWAGLSPLRASMIIGLLWGMDYLPFVYTEFFLSPGLNAANLIFGWFAFAPIYLWLYHQTGSSLIIVFFNVCMQFSFNIVPVLPIASGDNSEAAMANLVCFGAALLIWRYWPRGVPYSLSFLPPTLSATTSPSSSSNSSNIASNVSSSKRAATAST